MNSTSLTIRPALPEDVNAIFGMIFELAVFEKLEHMVVANEAKLHESLFGDHPAAEAIVGVENGEVVTFALFFHNFSTFLCQKGLYLEDLYVKQNCRGKGYGKQMLVALAQLAVERNCGRFDTRVMERLGERVFCKVGAEGVYCAALPDAGLGVAIKMDDGNNARGCEVVMAELIQRLVKLDDAERSFMHSLSNVTLKNWNGIEVGQLRAAAF
jgi:L-asparaginase II